MKLDQLKEFLESFQSDYDFELADSKLNILHDGRLKGCVKLCKNMGMDEITNEDVNVPCDKYDFVKLND